MKVFEILVRRPGKVTKAWSKVRRGVLMQAPWGRAFQAEGKPMPRLWDGGMPGLFTAIARKTMWPGHTEQEQRDTVWGFVNTVKTWALTHRQETTEDLA